MWWWEGGGVDLGDEFRCFLWTPVWFDFVQDVYQINLDLLLGYYLKRKRPSLAEDHFISFIWVKWYYALSVAMHEVCYLGIFCKTDKIPDPPLEGWCTVVVVVVVCQRGCCPARAYQPHPCVFQLDHYVLVQQEPSLDWLRNISHLPPCFYQSCYPARGPGTFPRLTQEHLTSPSLFLSVLLPG